LFTAHETVKCDRKSNLTKPVTVEKPEASVIHSFSPRKQTNVLLQAAVSPVTSEIGIKSAGYKN
jgi:hypothetical protein